MIDSPSPGSPRTPGGLPRLRQPHLPALQWVAAAVVLGLAACGGNDDTAAPPAVTDLAINAANAERVAGEAIHSFGLTAAGLASQVANNLVLDGAPAAAAVTSSLLRMAPKGGEFRPQAVSSSSKPCTVSGKITITVSQAVARKLAVGDFVETQLDACVQAVRESVGKAREVVTAVNATQTVFQAHGELTGFGDTDTGVTTLETGPYDLSFDRTNAAFAKISSTSDKAINVERRVNQRANAAYSFTDLKRSVEASAAADALNFKSSYTLSGSFPVLGATRFQVNTPDNVALLFAGGAAKGALKVAGTGGSSLLVTFLGDNIDSVRLDLDANGDGTIDQTQTRTADQLLQLVLAP